MSADPEGTGQAERDTQEQGSEDARRQGDEFWVSLQVTLVQAEVMQALAVWGELCFPPSQAEALKGGI